MGLQIPGLDKKSEIAIIAHYCESAFTQLIVGWILETGTADRNDVRL